MSNVITGRHNISLASRVLADLSEREPVATKADIKPDWRELDPATLTASLRKSYDQYVEARREAASLKTAFEDAVRLASALPPGMTVIFGYNFGKLSVAVVAEERKAKSSASRSALSLTDFIAAQRTAGKRT